MTRFIIVSTSTVFVSCLFLQGCTNDPAEFSQAQGSSKTISIQVESPSETEAAAASQESVETTNPAIAAGESKLDALFEGFDSSGSEGFNPNDFLDNDTETSEDPSKVDSDANKTSTSDNTDSGSGTNSTDSTTGSTSTTTGSTSTTSSQSDTGKEVASNSEAALCAKLAGVSPENVILGQPKSIKSGSVIAIKITGSNQETILDLAGDANAALKGICVFASGNQTKFKAKIGLKVLNFLFVGRGNQGKGDVSIEGNGGITAVVVSLKGNANTFHIKSNGKPNCADIYNIAKDGGFTCE